MTTWRTTPWLNPFRPRPWLGIGGKTTGEILAIMDDADQLHDTYEEWLAAAEGTERALQNKGLIVVRATINPGEFTRWCGENGMTCDARARAEFANRVAARQVSGSSK